MSRTEFWKFSEAVATRVVALASDDTQKWMELVPRLPDLPPVGRRVAIDRLESLAHAPSDGKVRSELWSALDELVRHQRAFIDAEWALSSEELDRLTAIAELLAPTDPVEAHRWLFDSHSPDLPEPKGGDTAALEERIAEARRLAVVELLGVTGLKGVLRLAMSCQSPWLVGVALADAGTFVSDADVLALLDSFEQAESELALGFTFRRARQLGWDWIERSLLLVTGHPTSEARVLLASDELARAWDVAADRGTDVDAAYWLEFRPQGRGHDFELVNESARLLLSHGRPVAALDMLNLYLGSSRVQVDPELVGEAIEVLLRSDPTEAELAHLGGYEIEQLLEFLRQAPDIDQDRLATLEWQLLPAIGFNASSPVLERKLSRDPEFFVQILSLCFKPRHEQTPTEVPQHVAENAFRLLRQWKIVPGSADRGGDIDERGLRDWVSAARELLLEADREEIGDIHIGQVLAHSARDPDGTWPALAVRDLIESLANESIESGFRTETYNKRGVTSRGVTDGGRQENDLADSLDGWAGSIANQWPRTAAVLRALAEGYRTEGRAQDEESRRFGGD